MRVVSQNAKGTFVNGRRMISIPLPPRRPYVSPTKRALKRFKEIVTFEREGQAESGAESHRHQHRKTMRRAWAFSVVINLLVFLLFYLVVFETREDSGGDDGLITVTELVAEKVRSSSSRPTARDDEPAKSKREIKVASRPALQQKHLNLIAVGSEVPQIEMSSLELSTFEVAEDSSLSIFSPSMTRKDFKKPTVRRSNPFGKGNKSSQYDPGKEDAFGAMPNDVNRFFKGKTFGDGRDLILFLDISGSMKERSQAVGRFVEINYPKASIIEVQGCNFRGETPALYRPMLTSKEMKIRSQVVFVCDLQDGADKDGVDLIGNLILQEDNRKSLNVISFNKTPNEFLLGLIERSNGSFKRAY